MILDVLTFVVLIVLVVVTVIAAVALANKTVRMVWAIMVSGERYREPVVQAA